MIKNPCVIGTLFVVAAPSGGGKTSLVRNLVQTHDKITVSISHTTRKQRPGEIDGVDYIFIDTEQFLQMVHAGEFLEHACVFEHFYGTSSAQINQKLQAGMDIVLDIDWQGAAAIKRIYPHAITIFIIPPSASCLKERLLKRKQDDASVIEQRMNQARAELSHYAEFDYLIVNDIFATAATELSAIVLAERCRLARQMLQQKKLLSFLLAEQ